MAWWYHTYRSSAVQCSLLIPLHNSWIKLFITHATTSHHLIIIHPGGSFLRRASHARAAWMARGLLGRSGRTNGDPEDALLGEEADLWDTVVREVEIERESIGRSIEGWPEGLGTMADRQRFLEARARSNEAAASLNMSTDELWNTAVQRNYAPTWTNTAGSGSIRRATCMEIVSPQICTVTEGGGVGRAIRAEPPISRSSGDSPTGNNRIMGFRVAFDHPTSSEGQSMGGCYLVGVTTSSFSAYNESNALAQSPFFWGIEDGGNKYEGPRHVRRGVRRQSPSYATELAPSVSRNTHGVIFGARDVVSVVCDMNSRTMCFWRNDTCLGPLVQGLPRTGSLFPVVVPFNARVTVAIGPLTQDLLPLLSQFSTEYRLQKEIREQQTRVRVREERILLLGDDDQLTENLVDVLRQIWMLYQDAETQEILPLGRQAASRLWYRCGMSLASLDKILAKNTVLHFDDWKDVLQKALVDDQGVALSDQPLAVEKGDRVQLVDGYEKYGDAAGGPLRPGDRGVVVELQGSPSARWVLITAVTVLLVLHIFWLTFCCLALFCSRSIRVIFNGRRWWYQPQALLSEKSGLIETAGVWFVRRLLRAHAFDPSTLATLKGKSLMDVAPKADDTVTLASLSTGGQSQAKNPMEGLVGRVVLEQGSIETHQVFVESIHPSFGSNVEAKGDTSASKIVLTTRVLPKSDLVYTSVFGENGATENGQSERMKIDGDLSDGFAEDHGESASSKIHSDLTGVALLDGSALESITKECKKNSEALANVFSAGLPAALLSALETAERQMHSLEPREDLPERLSAVGSLTLYIAEQLFSEKPRAPSGEDDAEAGNPSRSLSLDRRTTRGSVGRSTRRSRAAAAAAALADVEPQESSGAAATLQQSRGLLVSLMSRAGGGSGGNGTGGDDALSPLAEDLFFSRLPPSLYDASTGDRAALLAPGGHLFEAGSRSNSTGSRSLRDRNSNQDQAVTMSSFGSLQNSNNLTFLESILRSNSSPVKSVVASNTVFFQHIIRVGLWSNSAAWIKAALDKHIRKSPQKTSSILRQAYDEEGTPILKLAVVFGCSPDVVGILLACGAHVTSSEVRLAIETDQSEVLALFLRHMSLPGDIDISACSDEVKAVVEQARERQDHLDRKMRETAGEFMVGILKRLIDLGLASRRHRSARLDSCSRSISEILVGNVLLKALQQSQMSEKRVGADIHEEPMTGRFSVEDSLDSHPLPGLLGSLPESILGDALFGTIELATGTLLLLEDFLCSKDMVDSAAGLTALLSLLTKFPSLRSCPELQRFGTLELVSFHDAFASSRCTDALRTHVYSQIPASEGVRVTRSQASSAPKGAGMVLCPKKHTAVLHITRHSSFRCDLCGNGVERGRVMHGCRECDWDACEECTDKAESGVVKCAAIRELASECRKLLTTTSPKSEVSKKVTLTDAKYLQVIAELGSNATWKNVENVAGRLLQYDRKAIRDLAIMLRTPGAISVHQFQKLILPALHTACVGREECREAGSGHRNKKAKVASEGFSESESRKFRNPEERTGFCMELVRAMILDIDETPRKRESLKLFLSETNSANESEDGDDGSGSSESEHRQIVNEREIAFFAEASELLRRLQQVLSLYENVSVSTVGVKKGANGDMQSLTKPIEVHLQPCTLEESNPHVPKKLVLHAEPLVALDDIKRHALRCCGMIDSSYKEYCRR